MSGIEQNWGTSLLTEIRSSKSGKLSNAERRTLIARGEIVSTDFRDCSFRQEFVKLCLMHAPDVFASRDRIGPRKQRIEQLYAVFLKATGRPDTGQMLTKTLFHPMAGYTDISAIEAVHLGIAGAQDHIEPSIGAGVVEGFSSASTS